jgi:signal peptidase I
VYIDGRIARKNLAEQRALRIPVFDSSFAPGDGARFPRWICRRSVPDDATGGWEPTGQGFHREPPEGPVGAERVDWVEYQHWEADRGVYGPVRDFNAYNGVELVGENRVRDLMLEAQVAVGPGTQALLLRLDAGADRFLVTIPTGGLDPVEVLRNGRKIRVYELPARYALRAAGPPRQHRLEASVADHRLLVAVDGDLVFEPYDFDDEADGPGSSSSPLAIGARGAGPADIAVLRVFRDIYYTDSLVSIPSHPFGVEEPYRLGPGEFFVLGDNSPVSNDSRFWPGSPVVRRELFVGKPFLVHLPSQAVPLRVFGREPYWIPDPREIRYIR